MHASSRPRPSGKSPASEPNRQETRSAYEVLTTASEAELRAIFCDHANPVSAERIAREVVVRRRAGKLPVTTLAFAQMIRDLLRRGASPMTRG